MNTYILESNKTKNPKRVKEENVFAIVTSRGGRLFKSTKVHDRIKVSLQIKIQPKYFGKAENNFTYDSAIVKRHSNNHAQILNLCIKRFEVALDTTNLFFLRDNIIPTREEFKSKLFENLGRNKQQPTNEFKTYLVSYIEHKIKYYWIALVTGSSDAVSKGRILIYETLLKHLKNYETFYSRRLKLKELKEEDIINFYFFISDYHSKKITLKKNHFDRKAVTKFEGGVTQNTLNKLSKVLIALINKAKMDGVKINYLNLSSIRISEAKCSKNKFYLSEDQLKKVINHPPNTPMLLIAQNYLIISSLCGFRYELFLDIIGKSYKEYNEGANKFKYVEVYSDKTKTTTTIPLFQIVVDILNEHYDGKFPQIPSNAILNKKLKEYLTQIGLRDLITLDIHLFGKEKFTKKVEMSDVISSHDCRSSFISNMCHLGVPKTIVSDITHPDNKSDTKSSAFAIYDKRSELQKALLFYNTVKLLNGDSEIFKY